MYSKSMLDYINFWRMENETAYFYNENVVPDLPTAKF